MRDVADDDDIFSIDEENAPEGASSSSSSSAAAAAAAVNSLRQLQQSVAEEADEDDIYSIDEAELPLVANAGASGGGGGIGGSGQTSRPIPLRVDGLASSDFFPTAAASSSSSSSSSFYSIPNTAGASTNHHSTASAGAGGAANDDDRTWYGKTVRLKTGVHAGKICVVGTRKTGRTYRLYLLETVEGTRKDTTAVPENFEAVTFSSEELAAFKSSRSLHIRNLTAVGRRHSLSILPPPLPITYTKTPY